MEATAATQQPAGTSNPYYDWQAREGIPVITGLQIADLTEVALAPWERMGGLGAFINMGTKPSDVSAAYLCEIPPGGQLHPQSHMFEEFAYILSGRGATTIWNEGQPKQMVEWQAGSFIGIPMNARHQHFNTGQQPARLLAHHNMPRMMDVVPNERFIFANPFVFADRFNGEPDYFSGDGEYNTRNSTGRPAWKANFVPELGSLSLYDRSSRGAGGLSVLIEMAGARSHIHMSQFPVDTYKKGHVDPRVKGSDPGGGSLLLIVAGVGFSLVWQPGDTEFTRLDWKPNSLVIAPKAWYPQHFNTGPTPARYLALVGGAKTDRRPRMADVSEREGGGQIEYADENPEIHHAFEAELARNGAVCRMDELSPFCTSERTSERGQTPL